MAENTFHTEEQKQEQDDFESAFDAAESADELADESLNEDPQEDSDDSDLEAEDGGEGDPQSEDEDLESDEGSASDQILPEEGESGKIRIHRTLKTKNRTEAKTRIRWLKAGIFWIATSVNRNSRIRLQGILPRWWMSLKTSRPRLNRSLSLTRSTRTFCWKIPSRASVTGPICWNTVLRQWSACWNPFISSGRSILVWRL